MESDVIYNRRIIFREINFRDLAVPKCYQACPVNTIEFILHEPRIGRHKTCTGLCPYLLFFYITKFLSHGLLSFSLLFGIRMVPSFIECLGLILCRLDVLSYHDNSSKVNQKFFHSFFLRLIFI